MSSTIDYPECPNCGKTAYFEQDNRTMETRMSCQHCGYSSLNGNVRIPKKNRRVKCRK